MINSSNYNLFNQTTITINNKYQTRINYYQSNLINHPENILKKLNNIKVFLKEYIKKFYLIEKSNNEFNKDKIRKQFMDWFHTNKDFNIRYKETIPNLSLFNYPENRILSSNQKAFDNVAIQVIWHIIDIDNTILNIDKKNSYGLREIEAISNSLNFKINYIESIHLIKHYSNINCSGFINNSSKAIKLLKKNANLISQDIVHILVINLLRNYEHIMRYRYNNEPLLAIKLLDKYASLIGQEKVAELAIMLIKKFCDINKSRKNSIQLLFPELLLVQYGNLIDKTHLKELTINLIKQCISTNKVAVWPSISIAIRLLNKNTYLIGEDQVIELTNNLIKNFLNTTSPTLNIDLTAIIRLIDKYKDANLIAQNLVQKLTVNLIKQRSAN